MRAAVNWAGRIVTELSVPVVSRALRFLRAAVVFVSLTFAIVLCVVSAFRFVCKCSFLFEEVNKVSDVGVVQFVSPFEPFLTNCWHGLQNDFLFLRLINVSCISRYTRE